MVGRGEKEEVRGSVKGILPGHKLGKASMLDTRAKPMAANAE